jgi:hypothetical protein
MEDSMQLIAITFPPPAFCAIPVSRGHIRPDYHLCALTRSPSRIDYLTELMASMTACDLTTWMS